MLRAFLFCLIALWSTGAVWAQNNPPQLDNDIFVTFDARHGDIQRTAHKPWSNVRFTNQDAYRQATLENRRQAQRQIEALITQYEQGMGLPKGDWRLGILLNDLGAAFDDPSTARQMANALNGAMRILSPFVGQNRQVDLVFAQAANRLANRFASSTDAKARVAEVVAPALRTLKERKSDQALRLLAERWTHREGVPGLEKVRSVVEGATDSAGCPIVPGSELSTLLAAKATLGAPAFEARLTKLVRDLGTSDRKGCTLGSLGFGSSLEGQTTNTRLIADLTEISLRDQARTYPREWARAAQISAVDALARIGEFGTLDQFSRSLMLVGPLLDAFSSLNARDTRPADLAIVLAAILANESLGDFRRAEIIYDRVRALRPSSQPGQGGWGSVKDVVATATFHAKNGRRSRATELARLALGGFPGASLDAITRADLRRIVLGNTIDDGDWEGALAMLLPDAEAAAQAGQVGALTSLFEVARKAPPALDAMVGQDMIRHASAMLTRFGKDLSEGRTIRNDHVPAMTLALDVALRYGDRSLFDRARAVSARSYAYLAESRLDTLIADGDPKAAWLLEESAAASRSGPNPIADQASAERRTIYRLLRDRRYAELNTFLAPLKTDKFVCTFGFIDVVRHVARQRAAGRAPVAAELEKISEIDNLCAGNSASSVHEQNLGQMAEGKFWLVLGEPVVARRYLEPSVGALIQSVVQRSNPEVDPRDPEAPGRLALLARARALTGDIQAAREALGRASKAVRSRFETIGTPADRAREATRFKPVFDAHVEIAAAALTKADLPATDQSAIAAEALEAVQLARLTSTAATTARLAKRLAAADPALAALLKASQDASEATETLGRQLDRTVEPGAREPLLRRIREAEAASRAAAEAVRRANPRFAEAEQSKPASLDEIRSALGAGEGLLVTHSTPSGLYLILVTKSDLRLQAVAATRREIEDLVRMLRASVEVTDGAVDRFASDAAIALHGKVVAPLGTALAGLDHLIVVADGPFESLPFALLLQPGAKPTYLVERMSLAALPSVRSIVDLKDVRIDLRSPDGFLGIGDPILGPPGPKVQGVSMARLVTRSAGDRVTAIRQLASLPDTAQQLRSMSQVMRGRSDDLLLGRDASKARVKSMDLRRFRVITFATHAVVAGELSGIGEPGIVLTPASSGPEDDGLLLSSEIGALSLNADLVILSACNTAAADSRPGAEGLSGLARSFIGAGAKSLVVSHWPVVSDATSRLMTRFATEMASGAVPSKAMRSAMLDQLRVARTDYERHPVFWAPFFVVGVR